MAYLRYFWSSLVLVSNLFLSYFLSAYFLIFCALLQQLTKYNSKSGVWVGGGVHNPLPQPLRGRKNVSDRPSIENMSERIAKVKSNDQNNEERKAATIK